MRKEILLAIIAGALFGVVIAFGVWRANTALKPKVDLTTTEVEPTTTISPEITELKMVIAKPEELDVITESSTKVEGATKPNVWIAISAEEEDFILRSNDKGEFNQEVDLVGGVNEIIIAVFDEDRNSIEEEIMLVYSTEFEK